MLKSIVEILCNVISCEAQGLNRESVYNICFDMNYFHYKYIGELD